MAESIDYLIFSTASYSLEFTTPAAYLAHRIGAINADCFEVTNGCNSASLAIEIGKSFLINNKKINAIVICADQLESLINYQEKSMQSILSFADGCAEILLENSVQAKNKLIGYESITQSKYHDFIRKDEFTKKLVLKNACENVRKSLKDDYLKNTIFLIDKLTQSKNLSISNIGHIFINQGNPWLIDALIEHYHLDENQIQRTHMNYGHMGSADTLLGMEKWLHKPRFCPGNFSLLLASGYGFSWSGHLIQH